MANILVTGVGAIIGYGVIRALKQSKDNVVIGTDIFHNAAGQHWADNFIQAPLTAAPNYLDWLRTIIKAYAIDLIIPCIEQDVYFLSDNRNSFLNSGAILALNNSNLTKLTRDKWLIDQELKKINCSSRITSSICNNFEKLESIFGLPFIVKPKSGYASKGQTIVYNKADFLRIGGTLNTTHLAQPLIGNDDEEYTVGVFGNGKGQISAMITLRRKLGPDGATSKATLCNPEGIQKAIKELCTHFKPVGPTNFQFRKTDEGWKLLEINPRISSSTSIRVAFGYNDAQMCVDFFLKEVQIKQPALLSGSAIRYIEDIITYDRNPI